MSEEQKTAWDILSGILDCDEPDLTLHDLELIRLYASNGLDIHISEPCALLIQYLGESFTRRWREGEIPGTRDWHALEEATKAIPLR